MEERNIVQEDVSRILDGIEKVLGMYKIMLDVIIPAKQLVRLDPNTIKWK